uniref:Putative transposon MuDR mudrA-like protein, identical n=1 Tax=Solanum demissum TaxID=50514 RepID=Q5NRN7_SOLDE|nr:Putative transposon MuDR mudrA-like protein, identical [Solanum demissum]
MGSTIITLQMYYGGCFLSDPELRHTNGISDLEKIRIYMDELHIMFFHKLARELGVEQVETFGCKVNKIGDFYMLKSDADVLRFINNLKGGDFVDVYVVHQISTHLIVEDPTKVQIAQLLTPRKEDQQPRVDKGKNKETAAPEVSLEDLDRDEGQGQDVDAKQSDSESLYDVDENIDDLSDLDSEFVEARKSNIEEQVNKEKAARINVDEIPSGHVGIDVGFEDIYKNKRERYEGKLGGDDLYFDSSDPDSDISEDEGDPVDSDEVVDPPARNSSTKTYFPVHKCFKRTRNKLCTPNWICKTYKDRIMSEPSIRLHQIQGLVQKDYGLYVSKISCRRAKMKVINDHMGDFIEEFARLYDYAKELKSTNLGTTMVVRTSKNTIPGKEVFQGIYICLGALKSGWMEGCRRIIGFDGAYLKGVCRSELMSCISKDRNNQMYLVAWAIFNKKSKDTWSWFIKCIKHDLELTQIEGERLTVMSDMQKGLNLALVDLLPNTEIRWCARHIWANWKKLWSDVAQDLAQDHPLSHLKSLLCKEDQGKKGLKIVMSLKNGYTTGTARTATGKSGGATILAASTGVTAGGSDGATTKRPATTSVASGGATTGRNGGATTSVASTGVTAGGSSDATTKRPATTSATSRGATIGGRAANISVNFANIAQPTSQFSTQQSTTSASGSKKSNKVKRGGANPEYKRPRTTGFGVLFGVNGSVIERSGTTDRVLHCAPLNSSMPTNIDLGYKPNGLRWKGGAAATQRQLQEQSYKRATQSTPSTQDT